MKQNNQKQEKREQILREFQTRYIAHRGLFNNETIPENSLSACYQAVVHGFAIELDVQLTKDEKLIVFHDDTLQRMCGVNKKVEDVTYEELLTYHLLDTNEKIPLLTEVLKLVRGESPLLIEIKSRNRKILTAKSLVKQIKGYKGIYCIESFSPAIVYWYKKHQPEVVRGQLLPGLNKKHKLFSYVVQLILPNVLPYIVTKPDFLAYNVHMAKFISYQLCRKFYHGSYAAWTIKNEKQLQNAKKYFDMFIFDGFVPKDS